ncbi:FecR family protein [uncultured Chitinophaga sp.]|uniref:FecR family protein n=1 Tax=uncultured Chitinophaga sp. TaxID=339340 RepID=UPI0025F2161A|nr:FecR domain-containing protein [uncultured Chitinophaga sp.]
MKIDDALLAKYFKGDCSDAERAFVETYIATGNTPELDAFMNRTWAETTVEEPVKRRPVIMRRNWYAAAAAVIAVGMTLGWAWQRKDTRNVASKVVAATWDTVFNGRITARRIQMPDGSTITLNGRSSLAYRQGNNREVWLNGEAYFEVNGSEQHPFLVHTNELTTTVLGTEFNISTSNRADSSIEVSLLKGKVRIDISSPAVSLTQTLKPGQMLSYRKGKIPAAPVRFNRLEVLDWRAGKLVFENTSVADAFARIESRFGCKIEVDDPRLLKGRITAVFTAGTTPENILQSLSYVHQFTYRQIDKQTYIVGH